MLTPVVTLIAFAPGFAAGQVHGVRRVVAASRFVRGATLHWFGGVTALVERVPPGAGDDRP